ncbi:MAG: signal peptidase II [Dehalococcoidia bacterium]|jgi:signal peptidase II|nr:signal peptidase II [Dehalococcoidia bacterium]
MTASRSSDAAAVGGGLAMRSRMTPFLAIALAVVAADQATKAIIRATIDQGDGWPSRGGLLHFSHVENSGAAFGILQNGGIFLVIAAVVAIVAVLAFIYAAPAGNRLYTIALAFVLGGATGNLVDRVTRGTVTDFIDPTHYPAFNLADSAIVLGVLALAWLSFTDPGSEPGGDADAGHEDAGGSS